MATFHSRVRTPRCLGLFIAIAAIFLLLTLKFSLLSDGDLTQAHATRWLSDGSAAADTSYLPESSSTMQEYSKTASRSSKIFKGRPQISPQAPVSPRFWPTPPSIPVTPPAKPLNFHDPRIWRTEKLLANSWVSALKDQLKKQHASKQVSVVFSNSDYLTDLLNWLIAALVRTEPPLRNVIVMCLDRNVFSIMSRRGIPSVHIDPSTILNMTHAANRDLSYIWIVRSVIYRLINHFGYDVVSYDTDAVIMKNPRPLFDQHRDSDIVGSSGTYPFPLGQEWGFTLCMGMILFRSTARTELVWDWMKNDSDDQIRLNYALKSCDISWRTSGRSINCQYINGWCRNGLKVTVLARSDVCRQCLTAGKHDHYVWHQLTRKNNNSKRKVALQGGTWFLKRDWQEAERVQTLKGREWLRSLCWTCS